MEIEEIWKDIKGFEGLYQISNLARVKSLNYRRSGKKKLLSHHDNGHGYQFVVLSKNGRSKQFYLHRLVWETFNDIIPKGLVINHKSENKTENHLTNLECITQKENCNYGNRNSLISKKRKGKHIGVSPWNKGKSLTDEQKGKLRGREPWNKGKIGIYKEEALLKMSLKHKGVTSWNKGIPHSEETKRKISETIRKRFT